MLDELLERAKNNSVELNDISESEALSIEPRARTCGRALFSPSTSSVDPVEVMTSFITDAKDAGVRILNGARYLGREGRTVRTTHGDLEAGYVINAAGLYADRIAKDFGFAKHYRILPFKGLYLYANDLAPPLRTNIYPVPDLRNPFLGVHHTVTVDGHTKIGPTAIPCFWRENYSGIRNFRLDEFIEVVTTEAELFIRNDFDFRALAFDEMRKIDRRRLASLAAELARDIQVEHYSKWGPPGIRAQLLDTRTRKLEMDFRVEGDSQSFHILNAVSPAFTCAMSFSAYVFEQISGLLNGSVSME